MSARARVVAVVGLVAAVAVAATVLVAARGDDAGDGGARTGRPYLLLDLGVRTDAQARALRRAAQLYASGQRAEAARIFDRYASPPARVGAAFASWPEGSVAAVERLAAEHPRDSFVLLHLGLARYWSGDDRGAVAAWLDAARAEPDTLSALRAEDFLQPQPLPELVPTFVPSFAPPTEIRRLTPPRQLRALERAARRPDVRAKLLYGLALQRLGRQISAQRQYAAAVRLAPGNAEARVAEALSRFRKSDPTPAFSRLGPLTRRFPGEPTVRFHLGLALAWMGRLQEAERQFRLARRIDPRDPLGREADRWLTRLEKERMDETSRTHTPER
ncbi:MAG: hypothetical protein ICV59_03370 [Thermoleophilia bacterium]|nr:hypothetical protein [Thermoleophilia bacterium]